MRNSHSGFELCKEKKGTEMHTKSYSKDGEECNRLHLKSLDIRPNPRFLKKYLFHT